MKKYIFPIIVILVSILLGWLSGYDFATRSPYVAAWVGLTLYVAFAVCFVAGD
jgi:hypothetical protein